MPVVNLPIVLNCMLSEAQPNTNQSPFNDLPIFFDWVSTGGSSFDPINRKYVWLSAQDSNFLSGKYIISATLNLYVYSLTVDPLNIEILNDATNNTFTETGATWNNVSGPFGLEKDKSLTLGQNTIDVLDLVNYSPTRLGYRGVRVRVDMGYANSIHNVSATLASRIDSIPSRRPSYDIVYTDVEPLPPTLTYPIDISVNKDEDITFSWSGAIHINSELVWNDGSDHTVPVSGNTFEYTLPAGTANQGLITWKVRMEYEAGVWSDFSDISSFTAIGKPDPPTITNTTITEAFEQITWTSVGQTGFKLKIYSSEETIADVTLYTSDLSYIAPVPMLDDVEYTIELSIKDSTELWSDIATKVITSSFLKPDAPTFSIINFGDYVDIVINNGANTAYNEVLKLIDGVYTPIKQALEDETVSIYELVSGEVESLIVRAYRDGGGYVDSAAQTTTVNVSDSQIVSYDGSIVLNLSKNPQKNNSTVINASKNLFVGRSLPVSVVGKIKENSPRWTFESFDNEDRVNLNNLIGVKALFRDRRGFIGWFVITSTSIGELVNSYNLSITNVIEVNR